MNKQEVFSKHSVVEEDRAELNDLLEKLVSSMFFREEHSKEITWMAKGYWDYVATQGTDFQKKYLPAIREYSDSMKDAVIYELPLDYLVDKLDILDSRDLLRAVS